MYPITRKGVWAKVFKVQIKRMANSVRNVFIRVVFWLKRNVGFVFSNVAVSAKESVSGTTALLRHAEYFFIQMIIRV